MNAQQCNFCILYSILNDKYHMYFFVAVVAFESPLETSYFEEAVVIHVISSALGF